MRVVVEGLVAMKVGSGGAMRVQEEADDLPVCERPTRGGDAVAHEGGVLGVAAAHVARRRETWKWRERARRDSDQVAVAASRARGVHPIATNHGPHNPHAVGGDGEATILLLEVRVERVPLVPFLAAHLERGFCHRASKRERPRVPAVDRRRPVDVDEPLDTVVALELVVNLRAVDLHRPCNLLGGLTQEPRERPVLVPHHLVERAMKGKLELWQIHEA